MMPCTAILVWRSPLGAVGSALFLLLPAIWLVLVHRRMRRRHSASRSLFLLLPKLCLFLLLLLAFFDPIWGVEDGTAGTHKLLALVDDSSSMEMPDDMGLPRRHRARETLARISRELGNTYTVEDLEFDTSLRRGSTTNHDASVTVRETDLGTCLLQAARRVDGEEHAAVLLLTDGGDTRVQVTRRPETPLLIIGFGSDPETWNDLRISELTVPPSVNVDTEFEIDVTLKLEGERLPASASNSVILRLAEETDDGLRDLRSATIPLGAQALRHSFRIDSGPDPRPRRFSVLAVPMQGEASVLNNRRVFTVDVRRKQVDVLLYADTLNWDIRHLRTVLDADPDVRLTTMIHVTDTQTLLQGMPLPGEPSSDPSLRRPFSAEILNRYQCLILPPLQHGRLSSNETQALISYVDRGGGVVMLGSPASGAESAADRDLCVLRPWMPHPDGATVIRGNFPVSPARGALGHALAREVRKTLSPTRIPRLRTIARVGRLKTAAVPLFTASVEGVPVPVMAMQPYGGGMVLGVATDSLWLWHREGGASRQAYNLFWHRALRYLGGQMDAGRLMSAQWDRDVYQPGEEATVTLTVAGQYAPGELRIEGELRRNGKPYPLEVTPRDRNPGMFDGRIAFPRRGDYTVTFEAMRGTHLLERYQKGLPVGAAFNEGAFLEVDHAFLGHLARRSVDRYVRESRWQEIPPVLREIASASTVFATHALIEFRGIYLALVLLVLLGEWLLRRGYNLF